MKKQELLDIESPTLEQSVMQQLLATGSYTSLEASRRELTKILKVLPKTKMKQIPFETLVSCVAEAVVMAHEQDDLTPKLTATNAKPAQKTA